MMKKYSITIQGHRTSISLEPVFWDALRDAATQEAIPLAQLVTRIDDARTTGLASAIRVHLFEKAQKP